jgi:Zn-dependent peptidase ImmA (M78 family)
MPEHAKKQARAFGTLVGVIVDYLKKRARFPACRVPSFRLDGSRETIERAAAGCRAALALHPDAPIVSVTQVLEDAGVPIVTTLRAPRSVGVFSRRGPTPVVIANRAATRPSGWSVDLACELGHLVCHMDVPINSLEAWHEAYAFALAFLMPGGPFTRDFTAKPLSKGWVYLLTDRWRVSGSAVVNRAHLLGLMDAAGYRRARQELSAEHHLPSGLPGSVEQEPVLLRRSLLSLHESGEDPLDTCQRLQMRPSTFRELAGIDVRDNPALDVAAASSGAPYSA